MKKKRTLNERFTDLADIISEGVGRWWVTALSILLVIIWAAIGPFVHYSDSWQLWVNTPTTIAELFIGFLVAAAANRVERHHNQLLYEIKARASADLHVSAEDAAINKAAKDDIQAIKAELAAIRLILAKKVLDE